MRVLVISDAWQPQVNGVVRTLEATEAQLHRMGHQILITGPNGKGHWSFGAPSYPSITLEFFARRRLRSLIEKFRPDFIHIATEGPLGWSARNLCLRLQLPFTTSYHTRFPEYFAGRMLSFLSKPVELFAYAVLRRFHAPSSAVMVATPSIEGELRKRKFHHIVRWSRGVDTDLFKPYGKDLPAYAGLPRPILLYVGRVAWEKNVDAFLAAKVPGSKIVIGDGPDRRHLERAYPKACFLGVMEGEELARHYAAADLFVFPSATDTFGLVLLEAAAAGLRIAACAAPGPADIFADPAARAFAALGSNIEETIYRALALPDDPAVPRRYAESYSWKACSEQFFQHLQAPTPEAVRRITRLKNWLSRWWQRALALTFK